MEYGGRLWLCGRWIFASNSVALINADLDFDSFVKLYNKLEDENLLHLGPAVIEAFVPKVFQELGIFHKVKKKEELALLADSMHANRFDENLFLLGNKFTIEEYELFNNVLEIVYQFYKNIGLQVLPIGSISRALISYRAIQSYIKKYKISEPIFLEIGSGSGYLGLMLGIKGYHYSSVDVSQGFVSLQNALWNFANLDCEFDPSKKSQRLIQQIPWWKWVNPHLEIRKSEIVLMNHVIQEMSPLSLEFALARFNAIGVSGILVEHFGFPRFTQNSQILSQRVRKIHVNSKPNLNYTTSRIYKFVPNNFSKNSKVNKRSRLKFLYHKSPKFTFKVKIAKVFIRIKNWKIQKNIDKNLLDKNFLFTNLSITKDQILKFLNSKYGEVESLDSEVLSFIKNNS